MSGYCFVTFDWSEEGIRAAQSAIDACHRSVDGISFDCHPSASLKGFLQQRQSQRSSFVQSSATGPYQVGSSDDYHWRSAPPTPPISSLSHSRRPHSRPIPQDPLSLSLSLSQSLSLPNASHLHLRQHQNQLQHQHQRGLQQHNRLHDQQSGSPPQPPQPPQPSAPPGFAREHSAAGYTSLSEQRNGNSLFPSASRQTNL